MTRSRTARKTTKVAGEISTERQALAARLVARLPESDLSWKFGNASLAIDGKVFAFTGRNDSVAMKLPEERVQALVDGGQARPLTMGKRTMREWAVVPQAASEEVLDLMLEAQRFVASLPAAKPKGNGPSPGRAKAACTRSPGHP